MAFTSTLTAAIGLATKLSHLNEVFENTKWLKDKVLGDGGEGTGEDGHMHPPGLANALQVEAGEDSPGSSVTFTTAFSGAPKVGACPKFTLSCRLAIKSLSSTGFDVVLDIPYTNGTVLWVAVRGTMN